MRVLMDHQTTRTRLESEVQRVVGSVVDFAHIRLALCRV